MFTCSPRDPHSLAHKRHAYCQQPTSRPSRCCHRRHPLSSRCPGRPNPSGPADGGDEQTAPRRTVPRSPMLRPHTVPQFQGRTRTATPPKEVATPPVFLLPLPPLSWKWKRKRHPRAVRTSWPPPGSGAQRSRIPTPQQWRLGRTRCLFCVWANNIADPPALLVPLAATAPVVGNTIDPGTQARLCTALPETVN